MSLSRCHASVIVPAITSAPVAAANRLALLDEIPPVELTPGIGAVAQGPYMAKESCRGRSRRYNIPGDSELQTHRKPHETFREFIRYSFVKGLAGRSFAPLQNFWSVNAMMNKRRYLTNCMLSVNTS